MKKKVIISVLFSIILAISTITCYADTSNKTEVKGLGNEITSSINKTEDNINNFTDRSTKSNDDNLGKKAENFIIDYLGITIFDKEETIETTVGAIKRGWDTKNDATIFCKHCGEKIDADSVFCKSCGKQQ